jgi:hypothetical protein
VTVLGVKLLLGLFLTVLSAGFSLAETSFMSLSRQQLTRLAVAHPGRLDFWRRDPDRALDVLFSISPTVDGDTIPFDKRDHSIILRTLGVDYMSEPVIANILEENVDWKQ